MGFEDLEGVILKEETVVEKFIGDPTPENLYERVYIENGEIVRVEKIKEVD